MKTDSTPEKSFWCISSQQQQQQQHQQQEQRQQQQQQQEQRQQQVQEINNLWNRSTFDLKAKSLIGRKSFYVEKQFIGFIQN